ncbi:hypothetical protein SAMN04515668_4439 [Hymenobacter arizonensis]|uniref:Uncharacterized protein n=1 Tax=Hymenobacter arizonensis TaxID=1227077 RepID=A0A1I6BEV9_HYMAR|nr:hypothetical protein SAMN04515668_4439 [Hymenobacter arizonensis]
MSVMHLPRVMLRPVTTSARNGKAGILEALFHAFPSTACPTTTNAPDS